MKSRTGMWGNTKMPLGLRGGMSRIIKVALVACVGVASSVLSSASAAGEICDQLAQVIRAGDRTKGVDPSRGPMPEEQALIDATKIELLESTDYAAGVTVVDFDNDGADDVLAWNIAGSGRFVSGEAYELKQFQGKLSRKFSIDLGVLSEPRFVRFDGVNYLLVTGSGDESDMSVLRVSRSTTGKHRIQTVCQMRAKIKTQTNCLHPACRHLQLLIDKGDDASGFANIEWPHKYFPPAGLAVYFPEDGSEGDFDNSGRPTTVWRIGRAGYAFEYVYWSLLGQGDEYPTVDPAGRPQDESVSHRRVMEGDQHARLRRVLREQGNILSRQLGRRVSLPVEGEFFLFGAKNRTYWAWDLGQPPYGEEIHVLYTNDRRTDYIGTINLKRSTALRPCSRDCTAVLAR